VTRLASVNWTLPRIAVQGGPVRTGYVEWAGYLFCQQVGEKKAAVCVDLHDEFSEPGLASYARDKRVLITTEPPLYTTELGAYPDRDKLSAHYGHIFTCIPDLLKLPQAKQKRISDKWADHRGPDGKLFGVTAMISHKRGPEGSNYELRHALLDAEKHYKVPTCFYGPTGFWLGQRHPNWQMQSIPKHAIRNYVQAAYYQRKDPCFVTMFHVCIENSCVSHYVTEKLMDCFATHTVPLFCGDPDIGDEFDERGIIQLDRNNWLEQINALTPDDYHQRLPYVRTNFERSKPYWSFQSSILKALREEGLVA
jgi:hypothetical protein